MPSFGLSTHLYAHDPLTDATLDAIVGAGFEEIELFAVPQHFRYDHRDAIAQVVKWFKTRGRTLHSIHAPFYRTLEEARAGRWLNIASPDDGVRRESVEAVDRSLMLADMLPVRYVVVHPGEPHQARSDLQRRQLRRSVGELLEICQQHNVGLVLENIPGDANRAESLNELLGEFVGIGVCLDTGHANMTGDLIGQILTAGRAIRTTHIHDNRGDVDAHLSPYEGTVDWRATIKAFETVGFKGPYVLETRKNEHGDAALAVAARMAARLREELSRG
jgi:sugar phosphate isomerase/epimerase